MPPSDSPPALVGRHAWDLAQLLRVKAVCAGTGLAKPGRDDHWVERLFSEGNGAVVTIDIREAAIAIAMRLIRVVRRFERQPWQAASVLSAVVKVLDAYAPGEQ